MNALSIATRGYLGDDTLDIGTRGYLDDAVIVIRPGGGGAPRIEIPRQLGRVILDGFTLHAHLGIVDIATGGMASLESLTIGTESGDALHAAGAGVIIDGLHVAFSGETLEVRGVQNLSDEEMAALILGLE